VERRKDGRIKAKDAVALQSSQSSVLQSRVSMKFPNIRIDLIPLWTGRSTDDGSTTIDRDDGVAK
jgi:hypothetical protein